MTRLQRLGEYLRYRNALGPRLTELAILITARAWSQPLEWALHVGEAEARGIARATIAAIARRRRPAQAALPRRRSYATSSASFTRSRP